VSIFRPDQKDVRFEAEVQAHQLYNENWAPVRDWLSRLRIAQSPAEYFAVHRELFARFYACQSFEDECRDQEHALAEQIRSAKAEGADVEAIRPISRQLGAVKLSRNVAAAVRAVHRDLGDALVWRLFRYQRPVIAALGRGEVVGRLSNEGLDAEMEEIEWLWKSRGVFALHADITSCVRHGDILAFESLDPVRVYITESKKSGRFNSDSPQGRRLQLLQELVAQGAHPTAAGGHPLQFLRPGIRYTTYHEALRELLARARTATYAWRRIDDGFALEVWDESNPAGASSRANANRHDAMRSELGWTDDLDTIAWSAALRRIRNRRLDHNFAALAPLALTPLAVKDTTDLIFGRIDFISTLRPSVLESRLSRRGIRAVVSRGRDVGESFLAASRGSAHVTVPAFVREQVQIELMQLSTLEETVDWFLRDLASGRDPRPNSDIFYEREADLWEATETASR
jgi:hypothetical protein